MYGRLLDEPRLTAWWPITEPGDVPVPVLADVWAALCQRYGVRFDSVGANLYRDGRDSVAWHGDRIGRTSIEPVVAIVSLGEPRPFLCGHGAAGRPWPTCWAGATCSSWVGACQHDWEHTVPKVAVAGPRLSLTFRHDPPEDGPPP